MSLGLFIFYCKKSKIGKEELENKEVMKKKKFKRLSLTRKYFSFLIKFSLF